MSRYIDEYKLISKIHRKYRPDTQLPASYVIDLIREQPTADVQEVKHGKWEKVGLGRWAYIRCSECHFDGLDVSTSYCPNCGAKMVKE